MAWSFFKYLAHKMNGWKLKLTLLEMVEFVGTTVDTQIMRTLIGRQLLPLLILTWHFTSQQTTVANFSFKRHIVILHHLHHYPYGVTDLQLPTIPFATQNAKVQLNGLRTVVLQIQYTESVWNGVNFLHSSPRGVVVLICDNSVDKVPMF